jgi:hypothetical protein
MEQSKRQRRLLRKRIVEMSMGLNSNPFNKSGKKSGQVFYLTHNKLGSYVS